MGEKTVTLIVKVQLINVKDMMEIEKSRLDLRLYVQKQRRNQKLMETGGNRMERREERG